MASWFPIWELDMSSLGTRVAGTTFREPRKEVTNENEGVYQKAQEAVSLWGEGLYPD
jgi:hypothetical protein